jgi:hypothetical protein
MTAELFCGRGRQCFHDRDVLQQFLGQAVAFFQVIGAVVRDPDPSVIVFPDKNLKREVEGEAGSPSISGVPALGLQKISSLVERIFIPTFSASPLWSTKANSDTPFATRIALSFSTVRSTE